MLQSQNLNTQQFNSNSSKSFQIQELSSISRDNLTNRSAKQSKKLNQQEQKSEINEKCQTQENVITVNFSDLNLESLQGRKQESVKLQSQQQRFKSSDFLEKLFMQKHISNKTHNAKINQTRSFSKHEVKKRQGEQKQVKNQDNQKSKQKDKLSNSKIEKEDKKVTKLEQFQTIMKQINIDQQKQKKIEKYNYEEKRVSSTRINSARTQFQRVYIDKDPKQQKSMNKSFQQRSLKQISRSPQPESQDQHNFDFSNLKQHISILRDNKEKHCFKQINELKLLDKTDLSNEKKQHITIINLSKVQSQIKVDFLNFINSELSQIVAEIEGKSLSISGQNIILEQKLMLNHQIWLNNFLSEQKRLQKASPTEIQKFYNKYKNKSKFLKLVSKVYKQWQFNETKRSNMKYLSFIEDGYKQNKHFQILKQR